ncbi:MAG: RDD family protein [Planctomycetota bacterium]
MQTRPRMLMTVVIGVIMIIAPWCAGQDPGSPARPLLTATAEDHAWFVLEPDPSVEIARWKLCHIAVHREPISYRVVRQLRHRPAAIAAAGDRLWMLYDDTPDDPMIDRTVHELEVREHLSIEGYFYVYPRDREPMLGRIPGSGAVQGFVGTSDGPWVMLVPDARPLPPDADPSVGVEAPTMQRWNATLRRFDVLDGPADWTSASAYDRLLRVDTTSAGADLVRALPGLAGEIRMHIFDADTSTFSAPVASPWSPASTVDMLGIRGKRLAVGTTSDDPMMWISYLRADDATTLARVPIPTPSWGIIGLGSDVGVIEQRDQQPALRIIDGLSGDMTTAALLEPHQGTPQSIRAMAFLFASIGSVLLLVLVLKPGSKTTLEIPPEFDVTPPPIRLLALLIDLAPGIAVSMFVLRAEVADLLRFPYLAVSMAQAMPFLVMVGVSMVIVTALELATGKSVGRRVVGAALMSESGGTPRPQAILIRNAVKIMTLMVPPMLIFALVTPKLLGLHDILSRTTSVVPADAATHSPDST